MKNSKKGISLIVLIITIIVIVILATAILVSVLTNNPISEANKARYESDRDNMQAVFTNTVGKVMAENQGVVNVTAGQINTITKDASEAIGEVAYTVDNATVAANASGTIKFDKGTNDATTYYTGKKLPIYAAGETKWYVDSEGVLSLEVAGVKYGSGSDSTSEEALAPGLYGVDGNMIDDWESTGINSTCSNASNIINNNYSNVTKIVIPETVTEIGEFAFSGCTNLTSITIPNSVISIGPEAFTDCKSLTYVLIPNSVVNIYYNAFYGCTNLTSITIPESVTSFSRAFYGCTSLTSIIVDENNPVYDSRDNCNAIIETSTNTLIEGCKDTIIPNSVTNIGVYAFDGCTTLTSITIPNNITNIGKGAFTNCTGLTSIYIPSSVITIESSSDFDGTFYMCSSDLKIYCGASGKQDGWGIYWNYYDYSNQLAVEWGVTREQYEAIIAE